MSISSYIIPRWYLEARQQGIPKEMLTERMQTFCLEALQQHASLLGKPKPQTVDPEVVIVTFNMYEAALSINGVADD